LKHIHYEAMNIQSAFLLREGVTYLNFGSFGAALRVVFEKYQSFQLELEQEPVQFIVKNGPNYLKASREALSEYIDCDAQSLIFVPNPTFAVNTIAHSLQLKAGDEVLSTDLEYGACDRTWNYYCNKVGARYIQQPIPLPIKDEESFLTAFWEGASDRTKLIFISHLTSVTGIILPVEKIVQEAKPRKIKVFIDGAHIPGHLPLSIRNLAPDYYTGACHKWMMTPKGSSFMFVRSELQAEIDPLIISWGYDAEFPSESRYFDYHQFNGTRDFSAYLTIPVAIEFMQKNNWLKVSDNFKCLVIKWLPILCETVGSMPIAPLNSSFYGQMGSIPVLCSDPIELKNRLFDDYQIEIPVMVQNGAVYVRFSLNAFNTEKDLELLNMALGDLCKKGLIQKGMQ
jgi:isopenicillin-N epimerase